MNDFHSILRHCPLFAEIAETDLETMIQCLNGREKEIPKGSPVFLEGDPAQWVGVVLSGAVQIMREDYYGNRSVLAMLEPRDLFGEVFACAGVETLPVSVLAVQDSRVLLLDCKRVLTVCSNACPFHNQLVKNLLQVTARKNMMLNQKIQIMSKKTTREKLLAYLSEQAKNKGSAEFSIPLDRQGLADYLGVERSAMSAELSKLRRDGILDCKGAWFHLHNVHIVTSKEGDF